jgi:hypothetical protein
MPANSPPKSRFPFDFVSEKPLLHGEAVPEKAPAAVSMPRPVAAPLSDSRKWADFNTEAKTHSAVLDAGITARVTSAVSSAADRETQNRVLAPFVEKQSALLHQVSLGSSKPSLAPSELAQAARLAAYTPSKLTPEHTVAAAKPDVAKVEASHKPVKPPHVHVHPPVPPRSAFGDVLQAEAKEVTRANGVVASALSQGLAHDAVKAVIENRLQGHAKEIGMQMLAGTTNVEGVAEKLADSQKLASALQATASKARDSEHAQTLISARLKGDAAARGVSLVAALADPQNVKIAVNQQPAAPVPAPIFQAAQDVTPARAPEVFSAPVPEAQGTTAYAVPTPVLEARPEQTASTVIPSLADAVIERAPASVQAESVSVVAAPVENALAPVEDRSVAAAPVEKTLAPVEDRSVAAAPAEKVLAPVEDRSVAAAPVEKTLAPVEDRSVAAAPAEKVLAPVEDRSVAAAPVEKTLAPVEDRSVAAAPVEKTLAPVEDRSVAAVTAEKHLAPVEDRSVAAAPAEKSGALNPERISESLGKSVLESISSAAAAVSNLPDNLSAMANQGVAKVQSALGTATSSITDVIQSAAAAGAKVTLEDALASHMKEKGFDAQSIAAAGAIAEAIRGDLTVAKPADSILVLHKGGSDGDPLASVVQAKDVHAITQPGDSVLALDTLEKVATKGLDNTALQQVRNAMPEAVSGQTDLELSQSAGAARSAVKGIEQLQAPEQPAQKQEKAAAAEQSREAAMSMG